MKIINTFWWLVFLFVFLTLCVLIALALLLWNGLAPGQQSLLVDLFKVHFGYVFGGIFVVLAAIGFALDGIYRNYVLPIHRLTEETRLILSANPAHRIRTEGGRDIQALAKVINEGADRFESLVGSVDRKIDAARCDLEDEKNILAAVMAELPEGVLICNTEGRILLYNRRARQLLAKTPDEEAFIGLGRNIFQRIGRGLLDQALSEISFRLSRNEPNVAAYFVMGGRNEDLLRVETVPVLEQDRNLSGFVLIIHDITRQLESDGRRGDLIQSLTTGIRASLASLRSAIETLADYPNMPSEHRLRFNEIVRQEAVAMTRLLEHGAGASLALHCPHGWPMATLSAGDLVDVLRRRLAGLAPPIELIETEFPSGLWVHVDSVSLVFALSFLIHRIRSKIGADRFGVSFSMEGRVIRLDFAWNGEDLQRDDYLRWRDQRVEAEEMPVPLTLGEVFDRHGIETWRCSDSAKGQRPRLRLFIPAVEEPAVEEGRRVTLMPRGRPEFYDFDLFNQPGQLPEVDNRPLTELTYTVFDTETTGLNPRGGDEIISLGAARIVNGQLLRSEVFDQLVDPQRDLPWESVKIHGIRPEMLQGMPTVDEVLPRFHRFVSDTVLVGHNAAFDMRMLQLREASSGVRFVNAVLDTMLLSAVIHPAQTDHGVEAIAERLGVRVEGRHSALGDALTTANLLLRMIPLLASMNIHTLREARTASQKTYYARLKY